MGEWGSGRVGENDKKNTLAQYADLMVIGIMFVVCLAMGLFIGLYIDKWLGTKPWFTLIFIFLGIAAAFINMFRTIARQK